MQYNKTTFITKQKKKKMKNAIKVKYERQNERNKE